MRRANRFTRVAMLLVAGAVPVAAEPDDPAVAFFEQKVRPVLAEHCYKCHSAGAERLKAKLRLDSREEMLRGGDSGPALVPGKPDESLLIRAVGYLDSDLEMPPRKKLPQRTIADLRTWVEHGAVWPAARGGTGAGNEPGSPDQAGASDDWKRVRREHWAFRPVRRPQAPSVEDDTWIAGEIDRFVLAKLEAGGLKPASPAGPFVWLRRVHLSLTGVPPTPDEAADFVEDDGPDPRQKVVDRLLASPRFGERWARHWLDVARFNDGFGAGFDGGDKPFAWRYRDWVVSSLNGDLPYDDFVRHQIAGDLIVGADAVVATGFLALGPKYTSDGGDPEARAKAEADTLEDRMDTTFRGFQALTVACARCHDHKVDPIPAEDYYSIAGVFKNTREADLPMAPPETVKRFDEHQRRVKDLDKRIQGREKQQKKGELSDDHRRELESWKAELARARASPPPGYRKAHAVADAGNKDMHVALRGDLRKKGPIAPRRFLWLVDAGERDTWKQGSGRRQLAEHLASDENPLTARVAVNRIWQNHFGQGLVRSPSNFGTLGEKPSHPGLLDWLARELVARGYSTKALHREVVLSSTFGMSSEFDADNDAVDGDNRLLWRMSPRRLDVEAWRDSLLAVTGELDRRLGGAPERDLLRSGRRTLYSVISRNGDRFESDVFLRLFDFPAARLSNEKREISTVPQQFLFLLNSPFMIERARRFAQRLEKEAGDDRMRIERAYRLLYGRAPSSREKTVAEAFLARAGGAALSMWSQYAQALLSTHEFMQVQ